MARATTAQSRLDLEDEPPAEAGERASYTASLIIQGDHRFYSLSIPSDVLAQTCVVEPRKEDPIKGFQRVLDEKRAQEIANYIDFGFGTIPTSIILSAQDAADIRYTRVKRTLSFRKVAGAFLILDGQHRVFGFAKAKTQIRVPVSIYTDLNRMQEFRLFMDINTKQRPVPNELLLDIKRLAETESDQEALFNDVFELFQNSSSSPLFGLLSPTERRKGKISHVTFNNAMKSINNSFADSDAEHVYSVLSAYLHTCKSGLRGYGLEENITNPTLFRALIMLFPAIAERVADKFSDQFTVANFETVVAPFFQRLRKSHLQNPGSNIKDLHETFKSALRSGFTIGRGRS